MTTGQHEQNRINILILLISATTWVMLLVNPGSIIITAHCLVTDSIASLASTERVPTTNKISSGAFQRVEFTDLCGSDSQEPIPKSIVTSQRDAPISSLLVGWVLMLIAMMSPMLITPIHHIRERTFKRRRARSVSLFLAGYAAMWMVTGGVLTAAMLAMNLLALQSYLPAVMVGIIAFVWQCSPIKQRCLNRGHDHRALAAFGITADLDALHFGITHGVWCVGSCWALMLLPMMLGQGHATAMALVTFVMISERLERPRPLSWRLHFPHKLLRIVVAQTRICLQ